MRLILSLIAFIIWLLFGFYFMKPCFDTQFGCAIDEGSKAIIDDKKADKAAAITNTAKAVSGPLLFNWNKAGAITGNGWDTRRQSLINGLKDDEILEITGQYRADEAKPTNFENLGMARANEIAKLFKPPLTDDRIRLRGQLVKANDSDKLNLFKSAAFRNLKNTNAIKEIDDRTLIYFPYSSVDKLKDAEVEAYLNDVADRVKKSGERVRLTGHTDSMSSSESNMRLGQRRANIIKRYLEGRGVSSSKIIAQSKGETSPVEGPYVNNKKSAPNRRTELQIIK